MVFLKEICVDISAKQEIGSTIYSKQGDGGMYYAKVKVMDGEKPFAIPQNGVNAIISAHKPDGHFVLDDDAEHIFINEDGTVTVMLTDQMQTAAGEEYVEIIFTDADNGKQITSATFINYIVPRAVRDEDIESTDDCRLLEKLIEQAARTYDDVKQYADAASVSAKAAETAKNAAEAARATAAQKAMDASGSASAAAGSATAAAGSATAANAAKTAAQTAQQNAETAKAGAETAKTAAETAKNAAEAARATAAQKAMDASKSASAAAGSATAAAGSAEASEKSAQLSQACAASVQYSIMPANDGKLHLYYRESEE